MKYNFINQNADATETQETERVEIATSYQSPQSSPEVAPLSDEPFDFMAFIQGERTQALQEEKERHQATNKEINNLFDEMERLEKERPEALKQARQKAKETLLAIQTLIATRSEDVELEVNQVATQLREKTNAIVGELKNENL
ncbi:hypothetical protein QYH60_13460 (plasmid) [Lactococcus lactis subsp. lactis]|uniref:hypothetical protein n=1 Tax=Lactococcus lactis TaxID=1358 RepID=UPI0026493107|nr:hypothetical protein [Lactococcus lactis]WKB49880.1 hypothetical protein QYH60_13460 [Lactococcus lactis subsp. lactis]